LGNWIQAGQDPLGFEKATIREMTVVIENAQLRDARLAWQSAHYMRFAYHSPNDMPGQPGSAPKTKAQSEADLIYVRAWMKAAHNAARGTNGS